MIALPDRCGLCDFEGPTHARNFGLDLCEVCAAGHLVGRLDHWGATLEVDELDVESAEGKLLDAMTGRLRADLTESDTALRVRGRAQGVPPMIAKFWPRTLGRKVKGLWRKRTTTGDLLFDAKIEVETRTDAFVRDMIRNDGFQSAIMTLVSHCGGLEIDVDRIEVLAPLTQLDLRAELPLAVAAMLRHLADRR